MPSRWRKLLEGEEDRSFVEYNALFRGTKYEPSYAALADKALEPLVEQPVRFALLVEEAVARLKAEDAKPDTEQPDTEANAVEEANAADGTEEPAAVSSDSAN